MRITLATIDDIRRKLEELPPPDASHREVSKQEAVALLSKNVAALQARGYAMDEIAQVLSTSGLPVSVATLKSYMSRAKASSRKPKEKSGGTPSPAKQNATVAAAEDRSRREEKAPQSRAPMAPTKADQSTGGRSSGFTPREDSIDI